MIILYIIQFENSVQTPAIKVTKNDIDVREKVQFCLFRLTTRFQQAANRVHLISLLNILLFSSHQQLNQSNRQPISQEVKAGQVYQNDQ